MKISGVSLLGLKEQLLLAKELSITRERHAQELITTPPASEKQALVFFGIYFQVVHPKGGALDTWHSVGSLFCF